MTVPFPASTLSAAPQHGHATSMMEFFAIPVESYRKAVSVISGQWSVFSIQLLSHESALDRSDRCSLFTSLALDH